MDINHPAMVGSILNILFNIFFCSFVFDSFFLLECHSHFAAANSETKEKWHGNELSRRRCSTALFMGTARLYAALYIRRILIGKYHQIIYMFCLS